MGELKKLIACLKELGFKPKVSSFQDRLVIQKTTCLLEIMGFKLGYGFSLYVRGPYSPSLADDVYNCTRQIQELNTGFALSEGEKKKLVKLAQISDNLNAKMLEITATYAYLWKQLGKESKEAMIILKRMKPFYSEAEIAVGVSRAKELLYVPTEREIREMKEEFADFERASLSDMKD